MKVEQNKNLAEITSFGTGGLAEYFVEANSIEDIKEATSSLPRPFWIIGDGANSLISDKGLPGTTIHLKLSSISIKDETLIAESGAEWDDLVEAAINNKLWGLELMSGIPGSVGGAIVGNIAAYGQSVSDTLEWVDVLNTNHENPKSERILAKNLGLEYRSSKFSKGLLPDVIILRAAFKLSNEMTTKLEYEKALHQASLHNLDPNNLEQRREIIMYARAEAGSLRDDHHKEKTAGSFFKNPMVSKKQADAITNFEEFSVGKTDILKQNKIHGGSETRISAAHVILAAGYKRGQSWGNVRLHPNHILKIENTGSATSQEIYEVSRKIIETCRDKLGVNLESEVRLIGDFS